MRTWPRLAFIGALLAAVLLLVDAAPAQAAVAPSGFTATAGDTQVTLTWNNPGDNTITGYQVLQVAIDKLVVPSTVTGAIEAGDRFGDSVGIAGNTAVVGAPLQESLDNQNTSITNGGWGHTFSRGSGGWSYDEFLAVSNPQVEGRLGSSVAVAGSTVMAGAPSYHQNNNTDPGEVTIASKSSPTSSWATEFTKTGQFGNDLFGRSVALDTGIAVVGAPGALIGSDALAGKAYLYTKNNNVWGPAATAIWSAGTNAGAGTIFGSSVAVDSNTVVIGSPGEDSGSGAAYVFTKTNNVWSAVRLTASDRANDDSFGRWVAVDGDFVVVGAWQDDDGGTDSGSVYVFTKPSGGWGTWVTLSTSSKAALTAKLTASDAAADDHFGWSVSVDGDNVVVGAYGNDDDGADSGSVYLFTKPSGGWVTATETVKLTAPDGAADDNFGDSVAAGGGRVIVGAPGDESETGAAYVFSIPTWSNISNSDKDTTSYTVTGLDNDVGYTFLIRPVDSGGPGPASVIKHAKPQQASAATPANLTATAGVGKVTLSWEDPNDSTITAYKYRQKEAGGSFGQWTTIPDSAYGEANTTGYTVSNLTNGQTYTFRIRAVDEDDDTENSNDVTVTTILAAPTNLTATVGVGAGQIALDWDNPNNTLITKYQYSTDGGTSFNDITGSSATTTEYTVTGLGNGTEYTLAVRAVNASVNGEAATVTATTRLPLVPLYVSNIGQPTDTSVGADADLSSDQAQQFSTGANETGYVLGSIDVYFQRGTDSEDLTVTVWNSNTNADPGSTVHTLTNPDTIEPGLVRFTAPAQLAANTNYFVHVAFSGSGTPPRLRTTTSTNEDAGAAANWSITNYRHQAEPSSLTGWAYQSNLLKISINQVLDLPAAPANFEATVGDGEVALSWDDPVDDYITKYQYSTDGGTSYTDLALTAIDSSATGKFKYTIENLANGATYNLAVRAVNSAGNGATDTKTAVMMPTAPTGFTARPRDQRVELSWDDPGNANITKYELLKLAEESGLIADDGAKNDRFGVSVAVDDDTAVVGAFQPTYTDPDTNLDVSRPGAAYVYTKDSNGAWSQQAKLTASDGAEGDEFGIAVAVDGDTIVVGARGDDSNKGAFYVFNKPTDGDWTSTITETKLTATDGAADDLFGASVALYGESTIVVGAPGDQITVGGVVVRSGSAYVFTKNSGVWSQAANLTATDAATGDEFGISVAVDDDTIAVGAYGKNGNSLTDSGLVYVFVKSGGAAWATTTETVQLRASDRAANDNFGRSVAVDTDTIVVGASGDRNTVGGTEVSTGSAYVFARPATGWASSGGTETAKLTASDGAHGDQFGRSVAVDGGTIAVGAHQNDDDGTDSGSIYVFIKPTNGWTDTTGTVKLTASNAATGDRFGIALALDGGTALVAAPRKDANDDDEDPTNHVADAGSAYVIGTSVWAKIPDDDAGNRYHEVTGLINDITYSFAVRAVNDTGDGPASIATATPMPVPAAPLNLSAAPGDGQVALSWTDPAPEDDTITGYKYSTDYVINGGGNGNNGGASFNDILNSDNGTRNFTVTGLANGATHTLALRAVNAFGDGMVSTRDVVMVPAAPNLSAAAGDAEVALSWDDPSNDTITKYQLWQHTEIAKLVEDGGSGENDEFGNAVAVDGSTAVIGVPNDASGNIRPGSAFVFTRDINGVWSPKAKLRAANRNAQDRFGISVAVDGDTIVVGASGDTHNDGQANSIANAGSAYVFTMPAGGWTDTDTPTGELAASDPASNDQFGNSVAVDQSTGTIVVGAWNDDSNKGSVYVFTSDDNVNWSQAAKLTDPNGAQNHYFGGSVAVDGDSVLIGASGDDSNKGAAFVFADPGNGWKDTIAPPVKLTASDGEPNDLFGASASMDGNTAVIGAIGYDSTDSEGNQVINSGSAYVFVKPDGGWDADQYDGNETALLTAIAADYDGRGNNFGGSVVVDGGTVVVGADGVDQSSIVANTGAAYVFTKPATGWADSNNGAKFTASDSDANNKFGGAVAVSGNTVLVGADGVDQIAAVTGSGAAYVFDIQDWDDIPESKSTTSHTVTGLTNYQEYWFRVRAVNLSGPGRASETVSAIPRIGKPDKPTGLSAKAGDARVTLNWADPYNDTISGYQIAEVVPEDFLTASVGAASAHFGISVAIDGDTAVVGADRANNRKGSVYIFTRDSNGNWTQQAQLDGGKTGDQFGWSVAVDGDTVVVGAHAYDGEDDEGNTLINSGAIYVFTKPTSGGGWADTIAAPAKLTPTDPEAYAFFGGSVALDGNTLAIGSRLYDAGGYFSAGAAYVFTQTNGVWGQAAKLTASDASALAYFGYSVAVDDDTVLVGAFGSYTGLGRTGYGSAYVFNKPPGGWTDGNETTKLTASDRQPSDYFGISVALDGDTAVIGARLHNDPKAGAGSGAAYIFTRESGVWGEKAKLTASDGAAGDNFGVSVDVNVDTVVVGSWQDDDNGRESGSAYVFTKPDLGWAGTFETLKLTAPDGAANDRFGWSVAVEGKQALVGAYKDDNATFMDAGSAHVLGIPDWEEIGNDDIKDSGDGTLSHTVTTVPDGTGTGPLLSNGTKYNFQIRALNRSGGGPASDGVSATPGPKPVKPANFTAEGGDFQVNLTWNEPAPTDPPVTYYQYQQAEGNCGGSNLEWPEEWTLILRDPDEAIAHHHTVTGLEKGQIYRFRVQAVNEFGASLESDCARDSTSTTSSQPENPEGLTATPGDTQVRLTWDDPRDFSIDKYEYQYTYTDPVDPTDTISSSWVEGPKRSMDQSITHGVTVTGLTNGTTYTFNVRAVDEQASPKESGPASVVATLTGLVNDVPIKPATPTGLTATGGDKKVRLTWDDPDDASIDEYQYQYLQADNDGNFSNWGADWVDIALGDIEDIDLNNIGYTVSNLINGETYKFRIQAVDVTVQGVDEFSGASDEVEATPLPGQPREPENLAARKGDSQVTLTWQHPDTTDARIEKYEFVHLLQTNPLYGEGEVKFGYAVAVDGNTAVIGAYQDDREDDAMTPDVDERAVDSGAAYVFTRVEGVWEKRAKLTASDGEAYDNFGISVAVSGDTIVIGASGDDGDGAADSGSVYVFVKPDGGTWGTDDGEIRNLNENAKLTASNGEALDYFGHSVAVSGATVLVGAYQDDEEYETEDSGSAYVFLKPTSGGGWADATETAKLTPDDAADDDYFGTSVALDGDTAVIGAPEDDDNGIDSGSAYVFVKPDSGWTNTSTQTAKLTDSDGEAGDQFGVSVAVDGDTVVVGAYLDDREDDPTTPDVDETAVDAGSAFIFVKPDTDQGWADDSYQGVPTAKLTPDDGEAGDYFGYSVAVDIDTVEVDGEDEEVATIVVGAYGDDDNGDESGSAYVFTRDSSEGWSQTNKLTAKDGEAGDWFGYSVSVDSPGHTALVGAGSAHLLDTHDWEDVPASGGQLPTQHIVDGLSNGREYDFKVRAVNSFHQGPPAVGSATPGTGGGGGGSSSTNTNPNFREGDTADRAVAENALKEDEVGGPVTARDADNDRLEYSLFGEDQASFDLDRWTAQLTTGTLLDFETQNQYSVRVEVKDGNGGYDIVNLTITVVDVDEPPSQPGTPQVFVAGPTGLTVGWKEPDNQGPAITGYDVQYRETGGQFQDAGYNGLGTSAALEGLIPGTGYEVQVRAVNDEGVSPWSDSGRGETDEAEEGPVPTEPTIGSTPTPTPGPTLAPVTGPTPTVPPTGAGGPTPTAGSPTTTDQGPGFTPESTGAAVPTPMFDPVVKPIPVPQAAPIPESAPTVAPEPPSPVSQVTAPTPVPTPAAEPALPGADGVDGGFPWWIILVILIGIAAAILLIIWARRRRDRTR